MSEGGGGWGVGLWRGWCLTLLRCLSWLSWLRCNWEVTEKERNVWL